MKINMYLSKTLGFLLLFATSCSLLASPTNQETLQSLLHSLDYIAVDYPGAVVNGVVQDEGEYQEQIEFSAQMLELLKRLPDVPERKQVQHQLQLVQQGIAERKPGQQVAELCRQASATLIKVYNVKIAPRKAPDVQVAAQLFQSQCAQCHGETGFGDGPQGRGLEPPPINFHDTERQSQRNIYSLFTTITLGVEGTGMASYKQLDESQRWALAFYVSNFFASDAQRRQGEKLWNNGKGRNLITDLSQLTLLTPEEIKQIAGEEGLAILAYLRANPQQLVPASADALATTRRKLANSLESYAQGNTTRAYDQAMSAYLDGFELTEGHLKTVAPQLRKQVELSMAKFRQAIKNGQPLETLKQLHRHILKQLDEVQSVLSDASESATITVLSSMLILLREGLEAILVLAAIGAFLAKADRSHQFNYIHLGWISAVLLGVATWVIAQHYIDFSGANREIMEGIAGLLASAMLLYVGFWLHSQSNARQWKKYLHEKLDKQLTKGATWGLVFVAFIAVYREVLETVLFYQTFWLQSAPGGHRYIVIGFLIALVSLIVLAWLIFRFSVRLPFRVFFLVNAALLFVLSMVFAGKGIVALQEAGKLSATPVKFPEIDLLGVYPNMESLALQGLILIIGAIWWLMQRNKKSGDEGKPKTA